MKPTEAQIQRVTKEYSGYAGEPMTIEFCKGSVYAYGSELGCLRLYYKMRGIPTARAEYSVNLGTWYYTHEMR